MTQAYEAVFIWFRLYVHRYIRSTLESLRLQVESPVLGTSIAVTFVYLVGWEPSNVFSIRHQGLKTPVKVYSESCPLASVTVPFTRAFATRPRDAQKWRGGAYVE